MKQLLSLLSLCFLSCLSSPLLSAQDLKGYSLETNFQYGWIIKHREQILFNTKSKSKGIDLHFRWKTYGRKDWQHWHRYPEFGVTLSFFDFGNKEELGRAIALVPNFQLPLIQTDRFQFAFRIGLGLAYLDTTYDLIDNPKNNSISAHLNNITTLAFKLRWQWRPKWAITGGGKLTHYSNGATTLPNLGLNVGAINLGIHYTPNPLEKADFIMHEKDRTAKRKFGFNAHLDFAYHEFASLGGPKYPIYIASLGLSYHLSKINRLVVGLDYEYKKAVYYFGLHTFDFATEKEARRRAGRYMLFLGDEVLFGNWGLYLQFGAYISKNSFLKPYPVYNRLAIRYYLPPIKKAKTRLYIGANLKSHIIIAEYVALGIGAAL